MGSASMTSEREPLAWLAWVERPRGVRTVRWAFIIINAVLLALTVRRAGWGSSEFDGFQEIALRCVLGSADPYTDLGHIRAYPPPFGIFFLPFSVFGPSPFGRALGAVFFGGLCLFLYAWSIRTWRKVLLPDKAPYGREEVLLWTAFLPLMADTVMRCETDVIVLAALVFGGQALLSNRLTSRVRGGLWLGFAATFKVLPSVYGFFLITRRRWWGAAAGMIAGGVLFAVLLPAVVWGPARTVRLYRSWIEHVVRPYHTEGAVSFISSSYRSANQSMTAVLHRLLTPVKAGRDMRGRKFQVNIARLPQPVVGRIAGRLRLAVAASAFLFWVLFRRRSPASAVLDAGLFATVPIVILFLSEVSLTTHHLLLAIPFGYVVFRTARKDAAPGQRAALQWLGLAFAVLLLGAVPFLKALGTTFWCSVFVAVATVRCLAAEPT